MGLKHLKNVWNSTEHKNVSPAVKKNAYYVRSAIAMNPTVITRIKKTIVTQNVDCLEGQLPALLLDRLCLLLLWF